MTDQEISYVKDKLIDFIKSKKAGCDMEDILDFLDYINRVRYEEKEVMPLLNSLCESGVLVNREGVYTAA